MIGDNLINWEDSCKLGRPGEELQNQESPAQIGTVGTFVGSSESSPNIALVKFASLKTKFA